MLELVWTAPSSAFLTSPTTRGTPRVARICAVLGRAVSALAVTHQHQHGAWVRGPDPLQGRRERAPPPNVGLNAETLLELVGHEVQAERTWRAEQIAEQHYVTARARGLHGFSLRGGGQEEEGARHDASKLIWHPRAQTTLLLSEAHVHSS